MFRLLRRTAAHCKEGRCLEGYFTPGSEVHNTRPNSQNCCRRPRPRLARQGRGMQMPQLRPEVSCPAKEWLAQGPDKASLQTSERLKETLRPCSDSRRFLAAFLWRLVACLRQRNRVSQQAAIFITPGRGLSWLPQHLRPAAACALPKPR